MLSISARFVAECESVLVWINKGKVSFRGLGWWSVSQSACRWDEQSHRGQACHGLIRPARGFGACHRHDRTKMCQDEGNRLPLSSCVPEPCRCAAHLPLGVSDISDHSFDSHLFESVAHELIFMEKKALMVTWSRSNIFVVSRAWAVYTIAEFKGAELKLGQKGEGRSNEN